MLIVVILATTRLWHWHVVMLNQLASLPGVRVGVVLVQSTWPLPRALVLGLSLEAAVTPHHAHVAFEHANPPDFAPYLSHGLGGADLIIDLAADAPPSDPRTPTLTPLYDGALGEAAFWTAVFEGHAPLLTLHDSATGAILEIGQPAIERPLALARSAAEVVTRLMTGIVRAAGEPSPARGLRLVNAGDLRARPSRPALGLAGKIAAFATHRLWSRLVTATQWVTAWRRRTGSIGVPDDAVLRASDYTMLADDGQRYYADPFLFARDGRVDLFVEELPYATGRGVISVTSIAPDGSAGVPRTVLETPHHLSYPQVFARDGEVWMMPECSASGRLTLYRAARYPDAWEEAAILIDEPLHDATLFEHDGRFWIAAGSQGPASAPWGSSWDSLSLYSAPSLIGPWAASGDNPVVIDRHAARSAGNVFRVGGRMYRPVQDCGFTYGGALGIVEIEHLALGQFRQRQVSTLAFQGHTRLLGPHTLNRLAVAGGYLEAIDVHGRMTDLRAGGAGV